MQPSFWQGKRVFITGHTGFKGMWLALWLERLGAKTTGYALDPIPGSLYNDIHFRSLIDVRGDIRDKETLRRTIEKCRPEIILHLASKGFIAECLQAPSETFDVNVNGTVNLLECVRGVLECRAAIVVTSDKVYYGDCDQTGFTEEKQTILSGVEPYSGSKSCQEIVVDTYRNAYLSAIGLATARASNVMGGGDPLKNRLIPAILDSLANNKPVEIRNPDAIRPWQNILDCLDGYLTLAQALYEEGSIKSGAWNFGPDVSGMQTVEWIVEKMVRQWGNGRQGEADRSADRRTEMLEKDILCLDSSKAKDSLSWYPRWTLSMTLEQIVEFEKRKLAGEATQSLFEFYIKRHEELCCS